MSFSIFRVNGDLIRADREALQFSRTDLIARIGATYKSSISESTLRRAEAGDASRQTVVAIASGLGFLPERYHARVELEQNWAPKYDLSGRWTVLYKENDVGTEPYLVRERLFLNQESSALRGIYESMSSEHPTGYLGQGSFVLEGWVYDNCVGGRYYKDQAKHVTGLGTFHLLILKQGWWAEGTCSFMGDDGKLMVSTNIWLNENSPEFSSMLALASALMKKEGTVASYPASV